MGAAENPEPGDTVYTRQRIRCEYIHSAGSAGHVVQEVFEAEYEHVRVDAEGTPFVVSEVFDAPPRPRVVEQVAEAQKALSILRDEIRAARATKLADARDSEKRLAELRQLSPAVEQLEDFLAGRITHAVLVHSWRGPEIKTIAEALKLDDYPRDRRLISLFGRGEGDLVWKVNRYYDGSGSWTDITPCKSIEEAQQVAQQLINNMSEDKPANAVDAADRLGLTVSDEARATVATHARQAAEKKAEAAEKAAYKARAELEAL